MSGIESTTQLTAERVEHLLNLAAEHILDSGADTDQAATLRIFLDSVTAGIDAAGRAQRSAHLTDADRMTADRSDGHQAGGVQQVGVPAADESGADVPDSPVDPIAVAAGLLAGAAALAQQAEQWKGHWVTESMAAASGAAGAVDPAGDGADLAVVTRTAARSAARIADGATVVGRILNSLADAVAPAPEDDVLPGDQYQADLDGPDGAFRISFSVDTSRWANPESLTSQLRHRCLIFHCNEHDGVCDVDLLTTDPGGVIETVISLGAPFGLKVGFTPNSPE